MAGKAWVRCIPIGIALIIGLFIATWPPLKFVNIDGAQLVSRFSILVFFSLLIERTVEIIMSIWRSEEANKREATVQRLVATRASAEDPDLVHAQNRLLEYRAQTIQWTMPIGFALGAIVSAFGVRALSQFIDLTASGGSAPPGGQLWWFNMSDVLFTGALLAGGADPIHKILDLFRKLTEASAAKAAGTKS